MISLPNMAIDDIARMILFSGDRISCCDECVTIAIRDEVIAIATIAPQGEQFNGSPEIVGLYVARPFRGQGYSKLILRKAVKACIDRGFENVSMTVVNSKLSKVAADTAIEFEGFLTINDTSNFLTDMIWK